MDSVQKKVILNGTVLKILQGDLLKQKVEAIVNPANPFMIGGSGVDGRIHQAAGPELAAACLAYKEAHRIETIDIAEAVLTQAYKIQEQASSIKYVIHTVGPDCRVATQRDEKEKLLEAAYMNVLMLAKERGIRSLAFPAISTGAYSYPLWEAQQVAIQAVKNFLESHADAFDEVILVYYTEMDFQNAVRVWEEIIKTKAGK
jgi:O-acetyl-ADP-ribose deacetylase (regulator of RNase III)